MEPITVAVIDDNRLVREGLTAMLNKLPDFHAIAYADTDAAMAAGRRPSVLLLDMGLGDVESARVVAALVKQMPETRIVAMDLMPLSDEILELINAGVSGIVMKDSSFDEFAANLRAAQRLNIAAHTVKSHVRNVMEKLALHTRLQIAAYSRR